MKKDHILYLVIGVIAIVILGGVYLFKSQTPPAEPITALKCDSAYFNYVVGKPDIIVSAASVSCQFNYTLPDSTTSQDNATGDLSDTPGGKGWQCHVSGKILPKGSTKFTVNVTDDQGGTASCDSTIYLP